MPNPLKRVCHGGTLAAVCSYCAGRDEVAATIADQEAAGRTVIAGVCPQCVARFKFDSLKGGPLDLSPLLAS